MADEDERNQAEEEEEEADVAAMLDLKGKKKKKPKKNKKESKGSGDDAAGGAGDVDMSEQQRMLQEEDENQDAAVEDVEDRKADYSYGELLERVVDLLQTNNPDLVEKKRTRIKPPQLQMLSSKKTLWVNFQEICSMMQRDPQHVFSFFMAELGTEGSMDGNQRLIIRGKFVAKYIESLLRKYVVEYVTCEMCRSPNTDLVKNQASRLYFCTCRDCGSSRSVAPIRSGYHATSRADRRAARNAKN
uniref:Translation initiation factor IF2/IF5 domain-containing protein n=1 Tax=Amphora coffeiformis TaxID=265554 RepID=A0A7S3L6C2_9STRA|mmetsp:Transcript_6167/g.12353  ORF Transcript_6167/g.12353 Transcript_6167/m.12353 type:complete len:245 (+) Transcript_6167:105-839(+)|eukprot:scaffold9455_cov163-Amphora_coffeaeformis.AAC.3